MIVEKIIDMWFAGAVKMVDLLPIPVVETMSNIGAPMPLKYGA